METNLQSMQSEATSQGMGAYGPVQSLDLIEIFLFQNLVQHDCASFELFDNKTGVRVLLQVN